MLRTVGSLLAQGAVAVAFDDSLIKFDELDKPWSGILVGNGASRVVADTFAYASLYQTASSNNVSHPLEAHEIGIFDALQTRNFEQVLSALATTKLVNTAFALPVDSLAQSYDRIRVSLVEAIRSIHIPHAAVPAEILTEMRAALLKYDFVYSTNYDLLLYWAIMLGRGEFRDYFFSGNIFDISNTEVWQKSTKMLFLHGGLHLYRTRIGQTYKRTAGQWGNLLDDFGTPIPDQDGAVPLFITEGNSSDKLRSIYTSDYLSFAYTQFSRHSGPLVIFGHSLDEQFDQHLISAIRGSTNRVLGVGLHPYSAGTKTIAQIKALWFSKFHNFDLHFFDSSTHPLGSATLHVAHP
jgi:hypothetical protein